MTKAHVLDEKAKLLATQLLKTEGEILSTLMEMSRLRVFAELNYSGVFDYCFRRLGFSKEQSYYYKKVAEVSVRVPELKSAIVEGELSLSSARRIAPILTPSNQAEWIGNAKTMKQGDLERAVTEVNPQAHPRERIKPVAKNVNELLVAIDDETDEGLTILKDLLSQKLKRSASLRDVIAWAVKETRERFDPEKKAARARSVSVGNSPAPKAGRQPVPASSRHQVVRREGARCSFVSPDNRRCEQRRWIDLHHRKQVAHGGGNGPENLTFLCSQHHRQEHAESARCRRGGFAPA